MIVRSKCNTLQIDDALYTMCVNTEAPREEWIDENDRATQVDEFRLVDLNLLFVCMAYELGLRGVCFATMRLVCIDTNWL